MSQASLWQYIGYSFYTTRSHTFKVHFCIKNNYGQLFSPKANQQDELVWKIFLFLEINCNLETTQKQAQGRTLDYLLSCL